MKVELLLFAQLRDAFGANAVTVDVARGEPVADAAARALADRAPALLELPLRYAVGERFVDGEYVLDENDVVALLPPVSGG